MLESPMPAWRQLLFLFGFTLLGLLLSALAMAGLLLMGSRSMANDFSMLALINSLGTALAFALPALLFAHSQSRQPATYLGMRQPVRAQQVLLVIVLAFASIYMSGLFVEVNKAIPLPAAMRRTMEALEKQYAEQIMKMIKLNTWPQYLLSLVFIAVVPAFVEELFFRAALQPVLHRLFRDPWLAIGLTALVFSAIHGSWYGFLPRMALGVVLGFIFYYGQSLWLCVLAHAFNNAMVVTVLFAMSRAGKLTPKSLDENVAGDYAYLAGGLALIAVIALVRQFRKQSLLAFATFDEKETD